MDIKHNSKCNSYTNNMKNTVGDYIGKERKDKKMMSESLLLPSTSMGKTTSASIAERSNVWAENNLMKKKCALDEKLYRNVIKMNVDRLEVTQELAKLKKSSSAGALDDLGKHGHFKRSHLTSDHKKMLTPSTHEIKSKLNSPKPPMRRSPNILSKTLPCVSGRHGHGDILLKGSDNESNITIKIGGDSSSSDESDCSDEVKLNKRPDGVETGAKTLKTKHTAKQSRSAKLKENKTTQNNCSSGEDSDSRTGSGRIFSVTSCPIGRVCSANRSESNMFENVTRRYAKQISLKK